MPFKIKDLMIDVTTESTARPAGTLCNPTFICRLGCTGLTQVCGFYCTFITHDTCRFNFTNICGFANTHITCVLGSCVGYSEITTWTWQLTTPQVGGVEQFGALKEQLKAALEAAETQEKAMQDSLKPQTTAEVDMLEKKLTEALEDLHARKAELKKQGK
jgi:hypothetical protein